MGVGSDDRIGDADGDQRRKRRRALLGAVAWAIFASSSLGCTSTDPSSWNPFQPAAATDPQELAAAIGSIAEDAEERVAGSTVAESPAESPVGEDPQLTAAFTRLEEAQLAQAKQMRERLERARLAQAAFADAMSGTAPFSVAAPAARPTNLSATGPRVAGPQPTARQGEIPQQPRLARQPWEATMQSGDPPRPASSSPTLPGSGPASGPVWSGTR